MTILRLLIVAFLFQTTSCAVRGNSAHKLNGEDAEVVAETDEDKDVDADPYVDGELDVHVDAHVRVNAKFKI